MTRCTFACSKQSFPMSWNATNQESSLCSVVSGLSNHHQKLPRSVFLGADSLHSDKIGVFNLSIQAHAECVHFIKAFNLPLLVLGGGGYNICNVSKCWAYETSILATGTSNDLLRLVRFRRAGRGLSEEIPGTEFLEMYAPSYRLEANVNARVTNQNSKIHVQRVSMYTTKHCSVCAFRFRTRF